ncbi:hypothetical protein HJG60_011405 [Phyllostomus discolor]|uniref:Uncharacterized protein n=1 Tax=Phyllostomus discolor TaxID=89673 RepID=A0A834A2M9_9CHIR|nr:hypothetical protein HJG60_011405 [Phyllostomus discolor]
MEMTRRALGVRATGDSEPLSSMWAQQRWPGGGRREVQKHSGGYGDSRGEGVMTPPPPLTPRARRTPWPELPACRAGLLVGMGAGQHSGQGAGGCPACCQEPLASTGPPGLHPTHSLDRWAEPLTSNQPSQSEVTSTLSEAPPHPVPRRDCLGAPPLWGH